MTFEQILLLYLYREKKVTLQEFGTIELTAQVPDPDTLKKEKHLLIEGLVFSYDRYAATDEAFIDFYAGEKGRIKSLAASDIDLHLMQAKQIVNIGNPYEITGIGKIIKNDNGSLGIIPGFFIQPPALGSGRPATIRERDKQPMLPKDAPKAKEDGGARRLKREKIRLYSLFALIVLLAIAGVWAFMTYILPAIASDSQQSPTDTVVPNTNELQETPDTLITNTQSSAANDSTTLYTWKAYIRKFTTASMASETMKRYKSYGLNAVLETKDSANYFIYIPLQAALADTAFKRDSLRKWFARPVRLEKMQ